MGTGLMRRMSKVKRLNIRATEREERLIRTGAKSAGVSITDFILESACTQAEHLLADKKEFVISHGKWQAFLDMLDRPPRVKPELARLFSEAPTRTRSRK